MNQPATAPRLSSLKTLATQVVGQDVIEYSLLLAFVALGGVAIMISAAQPVTSIWNTANSHLDKGHHYAEGHEK